MDRGCVSSHAALQGSIESLSPPGMCASCVLNTSANLAGTLSVCPVVTGVGLPKLGCTVEPLGSLSEANSGRLPVGVGTGARPACACAPGGGPGSSWWVLASVGICEWGCRLLPLAWRVRVNGTSCSSRHACHKPRESRRQALPTVALEAAPTRGREAALDSLLQHGQLAQFTLFLSFEI